MAVTFKTPNIVVNPFRCQGKNKRKIQDVDLIFPSRLKEALFSLPVLNSFLEYGQFDLVSKSIGYLDLKRILIQENGLKTQSRRFGPFWLIWGNVIP